ncbi:hypothetical protein [Streptomyces sp. NPDC086519]|uniref:hypothetical protein n=1 Tax=Streptomyces sp. NPDC086519 TaxID=3154863 RepID=UPI003448CA1E
MAQGEPAGLERVALLGDPLFDLVHGFRYRSVRGVEQLGVPSEITGIPPGPAAPGRGAEGAVSTSPKGDCPESRRSMPRSWYSSARRIHISVIRWRQCRSTPFGTPSSSKSCTAIFLIRAAAVYARVVLPEQLDPVSFNNIASGCRQHVTAHDLFLRATHQGDVASAWSGSGI